MTEAHNAEGTTGDEDLDEFLNELEAGDRYLLRGDADGAFRITGWDYELDGQVYVEWERQPEADASFPVEVREGDTVIGARDLLQSLTDALIRIDGRHLNTGSSSDLSPDFSSRNDDDEDEDPEVATDGGEDEFPRDLDRDDDGVPTNLKEIQLQGRRNKFGAACFATRYNCKVSHDNEIIAQLGSDLLDLMDKRKFHSNPATLGWIYADRDTNEIVEVQLSEPHLRQNVRSALKKLPFNVAIYTHADGGSTEFLFSDDDDSDSEDQELVTDGGEDVIDQLEDLEAGDDIVITADGRDLHGQVVDHFVERYEDAGGYGNLMVDIELAERHVDGETIKGYGLHINATEKRSGWVHFGASIAYPDPDSEQYGLQDMTPITNVRMEEDEDQEVMTDGGQPNPPAGDETDHPFSDEEIRDLLRGAKLLRYSPGTGVHEGNVMAVFRRPNGDGIGISMNDDSETPDSLIGETVASDRPFINGSGSSYTKAFIPFEDRNRATEKIIIRNTRNVGVYEVELEDDDQPEIMTDGGRRQARMDHQVEQAERAQSRAIFDTLRDENPDHIVYSLPYLHVPLDGLDNHYFRAGIKPAPATGKYMAYLDHVDHRTIENVCSDPDLSITREDYAEDPPSRMIFETGDLAECIQQLQQWIPGFERIGVVTASDPEPRPAGEVFAAELADD